MKTVDMREGVDLKQPALWPQSAQTSRVTINPLNYVSVMTFHGEFELKLLFFLLHVSSSLLSSMVDWAVHCLNPSSFYIENSGKSQVIFFKNSGSLI